MSIDFNKKRGFHIVFFIAFSTAARHKNALNNRNPRISRLLDGRPDFPVRTDFRPITQNIFPAELL